MTLSINKIDSMDELYCHYPRQTNSQDCYIEIDCKTKTLSASYNAEIGSAVPFSVWHGHDQRFGIPLMTVDACNDLLDEIEPLAERVIAGYESDWNGNNHVARFDEDALNAIEEITENCNNAEGDIQEWNVEDWLDNSDAPASCSDTYLMDMVHECEADIGTIINGDIEEHLNNIRYENRRDEIETDLDSNEHVDEYKNTADDYENPVYIVRKNDGAIVNIWYNESGEIVEKTTDLVADGIDDVSLGIAECNLYRKNKPDGGPNPRRREIPPADAYFAALCDAVTPKYRAACKKIATDDFVNLVQKQFRDENVDYFANKKIRDEKLSELANLEKQIDALKKSIPDPVEPEYFSHGSNSASCCYRNLTGVYPTIEK